jgi:type III pantothenate kinase
MILCIDSGNTRIKWGVHDGQQWLAQGAMSHAEAANLKRPVADWCPNNIWLSNVAGAEAARQIRSTLAPWQASIHEASAAAHDLGVTNGYENPAQLGVDRWCALIGARSITTSACLVVMAGTATTIDTLDASGRFCGGLILPGLDLMCRSLASDTAALPLASGQHRKAPRNTGDAIVSGCLEAQIGAIERAFARISSATDAICLLSGGAAPTLSPLLSIPHRHIDNLVLEGLARKG